MNELPTDGRDPLTYNDPLRTIVRRIETHPAPVIAMVEGSVWGGACELVLSCDLILAAESSTFAITPARLGVPYNLSGTLNIMKVADMHFIKEMLFTAQPVPAPRMLAYGVLNRVVPAEQLEAALAVLSSFDEGCDLVLYYKHLMVLNGDHEYALHFNETDALSDAQRRYAETQYALFRQWYKNWSAEQNLA